MQNQKNRFNSMAQEYDKNSGILVPKYDEMQDIVCNLIKNFKTKKLRVLDIGAGSGKLLNKIYNETHATCVWQDFSQDFLSIAKKNLKNTNTEFFISDLNEKTWNENISGKFDVIVSSNAIHHLKDSKKKELYSQIFEMLTKGGFFFNADEIKGESKSSYLMYLNYWALRIN
jgi:tRNA (cmo5U34)-methyltransferase